MILCGDTIESKVLRSEVGCYQSWLNSSYTILEALEAFLWRVTLEADRVVTEDVCARHK